MAKGKTRRRKVASNLRKVIARNVKERAAVQFHGSKNVPMAIREAAGAGAFSKSTVQRILAATVGTSLEQLDALGRALDVMPYQLLMENFDAKNPQVAKGAMVGEDAIYVIRKAVRDELASTSAAQPHNRRSTDRQDVKP